MSLESGISTWKLPEKNLFFGSRISSRMDRFSDRHDSELSVHESILTTMLILARYAKSENRFQSENWLAQLIYWLAQSENRLAQSENRLAQSENRLAQSENR